MGPFKLKRIKNSEVATEMVYAKDGSPLPPCLQGIWWMDQRGRNLPIPEDPSYKQKGPVAQDELLVTWGLDTPASAVWYPDSRCTPDVPVYGGIHGHWSA